MAATQDELLAFLAKKLRAKDIGPDAAMGKTRGWDSMAQVDLILALEEKYKVQVPPDLFGQLTTVPVILEFINGGAAA
jgi:acyl carrier protein